MAHYDPETLILLRKVLEEQAKTMAPGKDRVLLRKARQTKTAAHISEWLSSPGLMPPK